MNRRRLAVNTVGLLTLGEWHNNHHHAPSSARQGYAWWEVDLTWYLLRAMAALGLGARHMMVFGDF